MSIKTVVKIVRPDQTAPFFYQSEEILPYSAYSDNAENTGIITSRTSMFSSDKLTLTRMITYKDQESKDTFKADFNEKYPDFDTVRQLYCDKHNHILTIVVH